MLERYTDEWWRMQAPPIVLDELQVEGLTQSIIMERERQVMAKGLIVERPADEGLVRSAVCSSFVPFFGQSPQERFPDLFGQVAHFVFHLAKDHSFADGNKRTAMSVSLALLYKEGINLAIDDDADPAENTLYKLISALVTEIITEETFASEFRSAGRVSGLRE